MRRTDLEGEFTRMQRESQRAIEILGKVMAELDPARVERRRPSPFARAVQRSPVLTYSRKP